MKIKFCFLNLKFHKLKNFNTLINLLNGVRYKINNNSSETFKVKSILPYGLYPEKCFTIKDSVINLAVAFDQDPTQANYQSFKQQVEEKEKDCDFTILYQDNSLQLKFEPKKMDEFEHSFEVNFVNIKTVDAFPNNASKLEKNSLVEQIARSKWVQTTVCSSKIVTAASRLIQFLFSENDILNNCFDSWKINNLVDLAAQSVYRSVNQVVPGSQISLAGVVRATFEILSSGIIIPSPKFNLPLKDPLNTKNVDGLFADIDLIQAEIVTKKCQEFFSLISRSKADEVFKVE